MSMVKCNCESAICPSGPHTGRCQNMVRERTNTVDMIGECCDACYPHYLYAGYALDPRTGRQLPGDCSCYQRHPDDDSAPDPNRHDPHCTRR